MSLENCCYQFPSWLHGKKEIDDLLKVRQSNRLCIHNEDLPMKDHTLRVRGIRARVVEIYCAVCGVGIRQIDDPLQDTLDADALLAADPK